MEHKKRYCAQCGSKTNDTHCEICGRVTNLVSNRFKETYLNLVVDDVDDSEPFDHIEPQQKDRSHIYDNVEEDIHEDLDHVAHNISMRPRKRSVMKTIQNVEANKLVWKTRITAFVVIIGVLATIANLAFDSFFDNESSAVLEDSAAFQYENDLESIDEQIVPTYEVLKDAKGRRSIHLANPTPYFLNVTLFDTSTQTNTEIEYSPYLEPYSTIEIQMELDSIDVEVNGVYQLTSHHPDLAYQYRAKYNEYMEVVNEKVVLKDLALTNDVKNLMQLIYASKVMNRTTNTTTMDIFVGGEEESQRIYSVSLDFDEEYLMYTSYQDYPFIDKQIAVH